LPPPVGAISSTERPSRARLSNSSWCARGVQPRDENQRENCSGSSEAASTFWPTLMRRYLALAFLTKRSS
jgi:hypothetical protein